MSGTSSVDELLAGVTIYIDHGQWAAWKHFRTICEPMHNQDTNRQTYKIRSVGRTDHIDLDSFKHSDYIEITSHSPHVHQHS